MFGLGAAEGATSDPTKHLELAEDITETCRMLYNSTKTGLGCEIMIMDARGNFRPKYGASHYILRPGQHHNHNHNHNHIHFHFHFQMGSNGGSDH